MKSPGYRGSNLLQFITHYKLYSVFNLDFSPYVQIDTYAIIFFGGFIMVFLFGRYLEQSAGKRSSIDKVVMFRQVEISSSFTRTHILKTVTILMHSVVFRSVGFCSSTFMIGNVLIELLGGPVKIFSYSSKYKIQLLVSAGWSNLPQFQYILDIA